MVEELIKLQKDDKLYLLGDYINKGPRSKEVLDYLIDLQQSKFQVYTLRGNHDQLLLDALFNNAESEFLKRGGQSTLDSFGVSQVSMIPEKYIHLLKGLDYYLILEKWMLVHAGFNFKKMDPFSDKESMLNLRNMTIDDGITKGKKIIHGHIPTTIDNIRHQVETRNQKEICLDAGCVYQNRSGMHHLAALELESQTLFLQENID